MSLPLFHVDVFTDTAFSGNPAAVCLLTEPRSDHWMQQVAREMNVSETAFVSLQSDVLNLRWFTPTVEVDLCGHATLATAHVLREMGYFQEKNSVRFHTRSGVLNVQQMETPGQLLELDFPAASVESAEIPPDLLQALDVPIVSIWSSPNRVYLVETDAEETVRAMQPKSGLLAQLPLRSVILTSRSATTTYDFVSRYFAPSLGINEDPVTGFAHRYLGPFWSTRLGKQTLTAYQASPRGGFLHLRVCDERVYISGQTITIFRGELLQ